MEQSDELARQLRGHYAALVTMCDHYLGDLLDTMDKLDLWNDTMLVVWTDHGFLLGEHERWAKCTMPYYDEVAHTPFFVWAPRSGRRGKRREALLQPSIDLGPTILDLFGLPLDPCMTGKPLGDTLALDRSVREAAIFGHHGGQVNITDGRYVYMRGPATPDNGPLFNYTLMPTHMRSRFSPTVLAKAMLAPPFRFTCGSPTLKLPPRVVATPEWYEELAFQTLLFDLELDPQ